VNFLNAIFFILPDVDVQQRMVQSLATIIAVNIGGYFVNFMLIGIALYLPTGNVRLQFALFSASASILNMCATLNGPILFFKRHSLFVFRLLIIL
jgi:hypothetical protein